MRALLLTLLAFAAGYATAVMTDTDPVTQAVVASADRMSQTDPRAEAERIAGNARSSGRERLAVDGRGHVLVVAEIDGRDMEVMVDTGASAVVLRESDARRSGHSVRRSDYTVRVSTANGVTMAAPITLRAVEIGAIRVRNVPALVQPDEQLGVNLLGMTFLSRLEGFRFEGRELILEN